MMGTYKAPDFSLATTIIAVITTIPRWVSVLPELRFSGCSAMNTTLVTIMAKGLFQMAASPV